MLRLRHKHTHTHKSTHDMNALLSSALSPAFSLSSLTPCSSLYLPLALALALSLSFPSCLPPSFPQDTMLISDLTSIERLWSAKAPDSDEVIGTHTHIGVQLTLISSALDGGLRSSCQQQISSQVSVDSLRHQQHRQRPHQHRAGVPNLLLMLYLIYY